MTSRVFAVLLVLIGAAFGKEKPRLVVLTDIGGDPDDQQSMIRLMTYANEFDIEGLIASASGTPGELKVNTVRPDLIRRIVEAYGDVRGNLQRHAAGYPAVERLLAAIRSGNPERGVKAIGEGKDSEGSNWIVALADREDPRPVNIAIWGGPTELAQALWRVRNERSEPERRRFVSRLRVYAVGHQDDSGPWIVANFPDLFYVLSAADPDDVSGRPGKGRDTRLSAYRGMYLGGDESVTSKAWVEANISIGHGPLGALYPMKTWTAPNPHGVLKEGDTPSWFYFLPLGFNDPDHPEWGGWGGRFRQIRPKLYNDALDTVGGTTDARATVWRWRNAFQNDFAARMDWCITPRRKAANHAPIAALDTPAVTARAGGRVRLRAGASRDPDGDALSRRWFVYREAGTFEGSIALRGETSDTVEFIAPAVTEPRTVHLILEVTDNGRPALTACRRAIVTLLPAGLP
ncbi:MAG: DUF1593 domain-containing protein [Bryobacterales bacterium]|nr:DUF1593 domain-containing protein [Bryobacterales bacterium]